ncbi:hypothetical protein SVIO_053080 [Streptomyces violaceusniger]|uniref:Uncharacterized protein n=1 Tax=Streptomyces violaceusniger TaxID=68280 RepID=A0A4D4L0H4_STRVO|nr:hypothetical protein SVIO_053080 [Streptomyces violaceusniger]
MASSRNTVIAPIGSSGQSLSATGRVERYGTSWAPVGLMTSAIRGSLAYVTRCPRATSSRMISRLGRVWLMAGMPTMAIWARRRDMRNHSFQVYGEMDTTARRSGGVAGARGETACQP